MGVVAAADKPRGGGRRGQKLVGARQPVGAQELPAEMAHAKLESRRKQARDRLAAGDRMVRQGHWERAIKEFGAGAAIEVQSAEISAALQDATIRAQDHGLSQLRRQLKEEQQTSVRLGRELRSVQQTAAQQRRKIDGLERDLRAANANGLGYA